MKTLLVLLCWFILFALCWPLALLVLVLAPIVWLLSIPFRILGAVFDGMVAFLRALFLFPAKLLR